MQNSPFSYTLMLLRQKINGSCASLLYKITGDNWPMGGRPCISCASPTQTFMHRCHKHNFTVNKALTDTFWVKDSVHMLVFEMMASGPTTLVYDCLLVVPLHRMHAKHSGNITSCHRHMTVMAWDVVKEELKMFPVTYMINNCNKVILTYLFFLLFWTVIERGYFVLSI